MRRRLGQRYEIGETIGSGATSTVHLGRLLGTAGFTKTIAIKRLHAHLASDATLRAILIDEARLVSRISHPNVVAVLDVAEDEDELFLVLEYARGATLAEFLAKGRIEPALAVAVMRDALGGLHAAHHARDASGAPLGLVHRDVTPRNLVATTDGVGKVLDFGIAKARSRMSTTRDGHVRGSLPYMAPEQLRDETLTPRTDVYAASVVLWEALTGTRLFDGETEAAILRKVLDHDVRAPSTIVPELPAALDAVVLRGLASDPGQRFASGLEMALALEASLAPATSAEVAAWVTELKEAELAARDARLAGVEVASVSPIPSAESRESSFRQRETGPKRVPVVAFVSVVLLLAGSAAAFVLSRRPEPGPSSIGSVRPEATASSAPAPSAAARPSLSVAPAPVGPSAAPTVGRTRGTPRSTANAPLRPSSAAAVPTKPADCPPYFVDDAGVRRFNRECLR